MSIYDNAGVALIPSGTKASKLYSVLPANGDGDFTHSRGSTATRVNKDGLIESVATNVPRLDYPLIDGVVQDCPALLLEPQRTNNSQYSEDFSNSVWVKARLTVTGNQAVSPDGTVTADKLIENTDNNSHLLYQTSSVSAQDYTSSIFLKQNGRKKIRLRFDNASTLRYAEFNLENGIVDSSSNATASIENYGNGWYRCIIKVTATATTFYNVVQLLSDSGDLSYQGDGASGVYMWGAMVEQGSYPTSYIPNLSTGTTTRSADVCNGSGTSAEFNDSEGVLFAEISALANDGTTRRMSLSDSSTSDRLVIGYLSTNNQFQFLINSNSSDSAFAFISVPSVLDFNKVAIKYKQNDFAFWINGVEVSTDSSGNTPIGLSELAFDDGVGGNDFYGKSKQLMTFKTALTDSELETLTSWDSFNAMAKGQLYTIE